MAAPVSSGSANCVACHKAIDASWAFCAACGSDNRDPALHQHGTPPHNHDFSFGPYCVLCGAETSGKTAAASDIIILSDNLGLRIAGIVLVAISLPFNLMLLSSAFSGGKGGQGSGILFVAAAGLCFLLGGLTALTVVRIALFDLRTRTVTLKQGFTFAPRVQTCGFDECKYLEFYRSGSRSNTWLLLLRRQSGRGSLIKTYWWYSRGEDACTELSQRTGIPLQDVT